MQISNYIAERINPFDESSATTLTNVVTGKEIDKDTSSFLLDCVEIGEASYHRFREARLVNRTEKLFDPIKMVRKTAKTSATSKKVDVKKKKRYQLYVSLTMQENGTIVFQNFFAMS